MASSAGSLPPSHIYSGSHATSMPSSDQMVALRRRNTLLPHLPPPPSPPSLPSPPTPTQPNPDLPPPNSPPRTAPPPPNPQVPSKPPLSVQSEWRLSCSPAAATLRRKGGNRTMRARERRGETCAFIEETCAFKGTCACTPNHWGGRFIRCSPRDRRYKATLPDPLYPALPHSTPLHTLPPAPLLSNPPTPYPPTPVPPTPVPPYPPTPPPPITPHNSHPSGTRGRR